jgi:hypothetical protein
MQMSAQSLLHRPFILAHTRPTAPTTLTSWGVCLLLCSWPAVRLPRIMHCSTRSPLSPLPNPPSQHTQVLPLSLSSIQVLPLSTHTRTLQQQHTTLTFWDVCLLLCFWPAVEPPLMRCRRCGGLRSTHANTHCMEGRGGEAAPATHERVLAGTMLSGGLGGCRCV